MKKPITPSKANNIAEAKVARLLEASKPITPANEAEEKEHAKRAAQLRALKLSDTPLYSNTLHGY